MTRIQISHFPQNSGQLTGQQEPEFWEQPFFSVYFHFTEIHSAYSPERLTHPDLTKQKGERKKIKAITKENLQLKTGVNPGSVRMEVDASV